MAKKEKGQTIIWVIISIVVIFLLFEFNKIDNDLGYVSTNKFNFEINTNFSENQLSLSIYPSNPCLGNIITGTIASNMPNEKCYLQYKIGILPWANYGASFNLNNSGGYTESTTANNEGKITFRINCNGILSNEKIITVTDCGN